MDTFNWIIMLIVLQQVLGMELNDLNKTQLNLLNISKLHLNTY